MAFITLSTHFLHKYKAKVLLLILLTRGAPRHASQAEPNTAQT